MKETKKISEYPKILVLMSTYNGEKYIKEQINSILRQQNVHIELLIRDDGSTDKTINILKQYEENNKNIHIDYGINIGACESFLTLLYHLSKNYNFDYLAFSDQDDIWNAEKLDRGAKKIGKTEKETLYFSPLNYWDTANGKTVIHKNTYVENFFESLLISTFPGCTFVINRSAYNYLLKYPKPKYAIMHDWFIYQMMAGEEKRIIYDDKSFINYRIHGDNFSVLSSNPIDRLKRVWKLSAGKKWDRLGMVKEIQSYRLNLNCDNKNKLDLLCSYKQHRREVISLLRNTRLNTKYKIIFTGAFLFNIF